MAVKTMVFPANLSGKEKKEKMAIMEAAISSSLSHPNVVQTFTYLIKQLQHHDAQELLLPPGGQAGQGGQVGQGQGQEEQGSAAAADRCVSDRRTTFLHRFL